MSGKIWKFNFNTNTNITNATFNTNITSIHKFSCNLNEFVKNATITPEDTHDLIIYSQRDQAQNHIIKGFIIKDIPQKVFLSRDKKTNAITTAEIKNPISVTIFTYNTTTDKGSFSHQTGGLRFWEFNKIIKNFLKQNGAKITRKDVILPAFANKDVAINYITSRLETINCIYHNTEKSSFGLNITKDKEISTIELLKCTFNKNEIPTLINELNQKQLTQKVIKCEGTDSDGNIRTISMNRVIYDSIPSFDVDKHNSEVHKLLSGKKTAESYLNLSLYKHLIQLTT